MSHDQRTDRYGDQEYRGDQRGDQGGVFGSNRRGEENQSWVQRILPGDAGESDQARRGGDRPRRGQRGGNQDVAWSTQTPAGSGIEGGRDHQPRRFPGDQPEQRRPAGSPGRGGPGAPGGSELSPTSPREQRTQWGGERQGNAVGWGDTGVGGEGRQPTGRQGAGRQQRPQGHSQRGLGAGSQHGQEYGGSQGGRHGHQPRQRRIQERRQAGQHRRAGQEPRQGRDRQHHHEESGRGRTPRSGPTDRGRQQQYEESGRGRQELGGTYNRQSSGGRRGPQSETDRTRHQYDDEGLGFGGARRTAGIFR